MELPSQSPEMRKLVRKTLLSAVVGTAVEWYDFYLYATAAAVIFNQLFFPSYSHLVGTLLAYATFAIGFFVRPAGSVVFGRLGDRIGRKRVLVITLLLMGGSTAAIGLLPTYSQIGVWAPLLLTFLRAVQGFGSGAEYAGAVLLAIEYAPPEKRGLYASIPYTGVAGGLLLSLIAFSVCSRLPAAPVCGVGMEGSVPAECVGGGGRLGVAGVVEGNTCVQRVDEDGRDSTVTCPRGVCCRPPAVVLRLGCAAGGQLVGLHL